MAETMAMDIDTPEPKGTKRKADDDQIAPQMPKRIKVRLHPHCGANGLMPQPGP